MGKRLAAAFLLAVVAMFGLITQVIASTSMLVVGTLLPSSGTPVIDWLVYAGAAVGAIALIWRTVIKPTVTAYSKIDEYGPVLEEIAKQFKSDSGSTLKDIVTRLETSALKNLKAIETGEERARVETATLARLEIAIAVLEGRLTGSVRSSERTPIAQAADAAADKVKATAADVAAALVEVVNPEPIKVQVINPEPIDVNVNENPRD